MFGPRRQLEIPKIIGLVMLANFLLIYSLPAFTLSFSSPPKGFQWPGIAFTALPSPHWLRLH